VPSLGQTPRFSVLDLAWRTIFRLGFPVARLWWRLRRPRHQGALVAIYSGPALLLVRPSYRGEWTLPGGSLRRGETPEAAARRELSEEIGLVVPALRSAGIVRGRWDGRRDRVHFFEVQLEELPRLHLDYREITDARLMSPSELRDIALTGPVAAYLRRISPPGWRDQT
jgi:8-oxo-dGTP diphosphatase